MDIHNAQILTNIQLLHFCRLIPQVSVSHQTTDFVHVHILRVRSPASRHIVITQAH